MELFLILKFHFKFYLGLYFWLGSFDHFNKVRKKVKFEKRKKNKTDDSENNKMNIQNHNKIIILIRY